jgi:hypothetical protein
MNIQVVQGDLLGQDIDVLVDAWQATTVVFARLLPRRAG